MSNGDPSKLQFSPQRIRSMWGFSSEAISTSPGHAKVSKEPDLSSSDQNSENLNGFSSKKGNKLLDFCAPDPPQDLRKASIKASTHQFGWCSKLCKKQTVILKSASRKQHMPTTKSYYFTTDMYILGNHSAPLCCQQLHARLPHCARATRAERDEVTRLYRNTFHPRTALTRRIWPVSLRLCYNATPSKGDHVFGPKLQPVLLSLSCQTGLIILMMCLYFGSKNCIWDADHELPNVDDPNQHKYKL